MNPSEPSISPASKPPFTGWVSFLNHLSPLWRNFLTSGMDEKENIEAMGRVMLINVISSTGVIFLIPFGMMAFFQGNSLLGMMDCFVAVILLLNFLYLRKSHNFQFACLFGMTVVGGLFFALLVTGGVNNTAVLWYYTFPLISSFLLGSKKGALATFILLFLAILFFVLDLDAPFLAHYSKNFILRFIPSFIVVYIYAYAFEYLREQATGKFMAQNEELNRTVEELKVVDSQLRKAQEGLEKRVKERTGELSKANLDLKNEMEERKRGEEDRQKLELQLAHAKKMEAIGTLAGGVAHDLNNVLSATVGYPDLILMDLPKDSPLREPILTIQNSGKKAAAIVQDLLTLARRGVVPTDVLNLNQVVESYLASPEFERISEIHPFVTLEQELGSDLLNIVGSSVHLSKTVMNLVNNAMEAMPAGGTLLITTESRYVDIPIKGYDRIQEGDYAVLTVSDTGHGMSAGDIERIFEPFFTKKVMGRSGTGLGMSVVWGTVKDHHGYIHVQSEEGGGTTFTLYFSGTRRPVGQLEKIVPMEEYVGNGESVLVVDDIPDQRELASRILLKLGYDVASVASGEEALRYLQDQSVDLLILDMIMDSGMDGLETYQQILEQHPGQKALIASGYSANERVKAVQGLGAGSYVKKPYTLEKIGMAVKVELARA